MARPLLLLYCSISLLLHKVADLHPSGQGLQRLAMILRHVASSTHEGLFGGPTQQDHRVRQEGRPQKPDCPQRAGGEAKGGALGAVKARRTPEASLLTVTTAPFQG